MINIITLNFPMNGKGITNTTFDGKESLLDADLVVVDPSKIGSNWVKGSAYNQLGEPVNRFETTVWQESINGHISKKFNNYSFLPNLGFLPFLKEGFGSGSTPIILKNPRSIFSPYFKAFKDELNYSVYLDVDMNPELTFLSNRSDKPVGFLVEYGKGLISFLPAPNPSTDKLKLTNILVSCVNKFLHNHKSTSPPEWVQEYIIPGENEFTQRINNIVKALEELEMEKQETEKIRDELTKYKALLYEQGQILENIVIESFRLFGFQAENRKSDDLEHDIVFHSNEGKGIAELEGKDNDAVNISKLDQLNRAVDEDFFLTNEYPHGVLIGNHFRLLSPDSRKEPFTEKVLIMSKKKSFGLLTTVEIYKAVERILRNPEDEQFKQSCREKILNTSGEIIRLI